MKKLSEILEISKSKYIVNELLHTCIIKGYFGEVDPEEICESSGVFKGAYKISKIVANKIQDKFNSYNIKKNKVEFNIEFSKEDFSNVEYKDFFDELSVVVIKTNDFYKDESGDAWIMPKDQTTYDPINKRFGIITIYIQLPQDFFKELDSCVSLIEHELNHWYQDLNRKNAGKSMIHDKIAREKFIRKMKISDKEKSDVRGFLNKDECNSYLAQIDGELNGNKFHSYKECIDWIEANSNAWQIYKGLREWCTQEGGQVYTLFCKSWSKFFNHLFYIIQDHVIENGLISKSSTHHKFN